MDEVLDLSTLRADTEQLVDLLIHDKGDGLGHVVELLPGNLGRPGHRVGVVDDEHDGRRAHLRHHGRIGIGHVLDEAEGYEVLHCNLSDAAFGDSGAFKLGEGPERPGLGFERVPVKEDRIPVHDRLRGDLQDIGRGTPAGIPVRLHKCFVRFRQVQMDMGAQSEAPVHQTGHGVSTRGRHVNALLHRARPRADASVEDDLLQVGTVRHMVQPSQSGRSEIVHSLISCSFHHRRVRYGTGIPSSP